MVGLHGAGETGAGAATGDPTGTAMTGVVAGAAGA